MRVFGSLPAEKCVTLLCDKLNIFNISLASDIIAITTDGAAVMKKVGRLIDASQQLCLAHGIQLAVLSVLYKHTPEEPLSEELLPNYDADTDSDGESSVENDYENDCEENEDFGGLNVILERKNMLVEHLQLKLILIKIRGIAILFRRSPTKNDILQKIIKNEHGRS